MFSGGNSQSMSEQQDGAAQSSDEQTIPDGSGGVITRTAPSTAGESYAGGTIVENDVGDSQEELMAAIEATIKPFDDGDLITGTVVKIDKDEVLLDIGYTSEGVIPSRELSIRNDVDPGEVVSLGDQLEALVLQKEDKDGRLILSKKRAQYERAWGKIEEIKSRDGTVTGPVIEVVKGGLILDIGLRGFLPASLVEMRRVRDLQPYVGKELECRIIELDKNRNNVVLSRRKFLEESQAEQRQDFLTSLHKGERRTGTVSSIVNFGAFVDLGGVDGLVHVSELSWKHVDHPSEVVEVGEEVEIEVLDVDLERERVSLSLKATQEDPWRQFARLHSVGDVIEGRVTKLVPFGAFVEVDEAIEGLVHISELADHHVERAEDEVGVHDKVEVKIIDIDLDRRRISLSRRQAMKSAAEPAPIETSAAAAPAATEEAEPEMQLEEAEMELEAREASEDAGVPTEDTIQRPPGDEDLASAAEQSPELTPEPSSPEAVTVPEDAGAERGGRSNLSHGPGRLPGRTREPRGREWRQAAQHRHPPWSGGARRGSRSRRGRRRPGRRGGTRRDLRGSRRARHRIPGARGRGGGRGRAGAVRYRGRRIDRIHSGGPEATARPRLGPR
jgi:small subunit ribosomal protein S1